MEKIENKEDLLNLIEKSNNKLVIIKFGAEWCMPCKMLTKVIDTITNNDVIFGEVDVDKYPDDLNEYNIRTIPVMIFYKEGMIVDKTIGALSKKEIEDKINENLNK